MIVGHGCWLVALPIPAKVRDTIVTNPREDHLLPLMRAPLIVAHFLPLHASSNGHLIALGASPYILDLIGVWSQEDVMPDPPGCCTVILLFRFADLS